MMKLAILMMALVVMFVMVVNVVLVVVNVAAVGSSDCGRNALLITCLACILFGSPWCL